MRRANTLRPLYAAEEGQIAPAVPQEADDEILRAEGLGWLAAGARLSNHIAVRAQ